MSKSLKENFGLLALAGVLLFGALFYGASQAFATPMLQGATVQTAIATSSPVYMTPGTATTTLYYDTRELDGTLQTKSGNSYSVNSAVLLEHLKASSTATVLVTKLEYSNGNGCATTPSACDWYENNLNVFAAGAVAVATPNSFTNTFASTTPNGVATATDFSRKAFSIQIPTRYVRVVLTMTGANGAVYAQIIPQKEAPIK